MPVAPAVIASYEHGVTVRATRITGPISIDGRLDEAVYAQVPAITQFVQQEPRFGTPTSESTTAWVFAAIATNATASAATKVAFAR